MSGWMPHTASPSGFVGADGHTIAFEYRRSEHLVKGFETVDAATDSRFLFFQVLVGGVIGLALSWLLCTGVAAAFPATSKSPK